MGLIGISILILTALVFCIFYLIFKKLNSEASPFGNKYFWIISLFSVPIIYIIAIYLWFLASSSYKPQQFDQNKWSENSDQRYLYVEDLIENKKLIGLSNIELKSLLSEVEYEDDSIMQFYIGYSPRTFLNMDPDWLIIELKDNIATDVYLKD